VAGGEELVFDRPRGDVAINHDIQKKEKKKEKKERHPFFAVK
jgi:hypothetical protein